MCARVSVCVCDGDQPMMMIVRRGAKRYSFGSLQVPFVYDSHVCVCVCGCWARMLGTKALL